jgi:predicted  nucleic acid-binding Zn-ribbon protein
MKLDEVKLNILNHFSEESILKDEVFLSKLKDQLSACEKRIAEVRERHDNIREIVILAPKSSINISAALEWKDIKEETVKLNGKSIKLHKEITELSAKIKRRKELRLWATT